MDSAGGADANRIVQRGDDYRQETDIDPHKLIVMSKNIQPVTAHIRRTS